MTVTSKAHKRHILLMQNSLKILGYILSNITQETATSFRDGPEGWTVLEVLCHLRDFDGFFHHRAIMMLQEDYPALPAYDHEALAIERAYNRQNLKQVYAELQQSRQILVDFFSHLTSEQWERAGVHPERGHFTMTDAVMQIGLHEVNHIEQITRILAEATQT